MELPVSNKEEASGTIVLVSCVLIGLMVLLNQHFLMFIPAYVISAIIIIFYAIFLLKRQNIKSLTYDCRQLFVNYNNRTITIPIQTIKSIKRGIGGLDIKLQMTITYKISLAESFPFGNIIWITYRTHNTTKEFVEEDPYELKVLKRDLDRYASC